MSKTPSPNTPVQAINPQQIMQQAQNLKNRHAQVRGQSIQLDADGSSDLVNGMLQIISQVLQANQQMDARLKQLEGELQESKKEPKKIQEHASIDPKGVAKGR